MRGHGHWKLNDTAQRYKYCKFTKSYKYGGFIKGILRGVRCTKSLRVLFLHRRPHSCTVLKSSARNYRHSFSRKQAQNARFLWLNTSVLGLFSRKRRSINSGTVFIFNEPAYIHKTERISMMYRGPGFLAVVWYGSFLPPSSASKLSIFIGLPVCRRRRSSLLTGKGRGYARSQTIQPQECLTLYKSFSTLCLPYHPSPLVAPPTRKEHTLQTSRLTFSPMSMLTTSAPPEPGGRYISKLFIHTFMGTNLFWPVMGLECYRLWLFPAAVEKDWQVELCPVKNNKDDRSDPDISNWHCSRHFWRRSLLSEQ